MTSDPSRPDDTEPDGGVLGSEPGSTDVLVDGIPSSPPLVNPIQGFAVFPSVEVIFFGSNL